ncbi:PilN domain-containing protein [Desulfatiglans anilini]|uniref:PilN domain-containing protein n=1 Tax=Desulfatiglans anilini TaxID=90728 RepID=UPI0004073FD1|nr:PilN domain-containing protein [Desulfatiglans anilini]
MIRINLLPFRDARKREDVRRQISIFVLLIMLVISLMGSIYCDLVNRLDRLKDEKNRKTAEVQKTSEVNRRLQELRRSLEIVKNRLAVIEQLELQQVKPVQWLNDIARSVPAQRLWLDLLQENGGFLTLRGTARDHESVAAFMTNLEKTNTIVSVDLESAHLKNFSLYQADLVDFTVGCRTSAFKQISSHGQVSKMTSISPR